MFVFLLVLFVIILVTYLIFDYNGPRVVKLKTYDAFGINCLKSNDLNVQEFDLKGNLWATRGFLIYCLRTGEDKFIKVGRVPSGYSIFWLNNFRLVRLLTLRSETVEMTVNEEGGLCAFSSGRVWYCNGIGEKFHMTMKLPRFGFGVGRGLMSTCLLQAYDQGLFIGEYFSNPERSNVKIYEFKYSDLKWEVSYEFESGEIRHIHALQRDPYTGKLWICTGDEDKEAMIGSSDDNYKTINPIGHGSQVYRACQLVFTKDFVFWGTDTGSAEFSGIYKWDKNKMVLTKLSTIEGAVFFSVRLNNGTILMSTDREGFPNEEDDLTRLINLRNNNKIISITCGTWKYKSHGFRFNFAKLRFQRSHGDKALVVSVLNHKENNESDLLFFSEENITQRFAAIESNDKTSIKASLVYSANSR